VKAQGLVFMGVRTVDTYVMAAFFTDVLGFPVAEKAHDFVRFQLPNRDQIELWGPSLETQAHVTTGPMPEFLVHDVEQAQAELEGAGVEILSPVRSWREGYGSVHFRGPDGNVYGAVSGRYYD
jgi:catechol 2,3-dioxygenase-like lactoylglutathione lyase family enzyme